MRAILGIDPGLVNTGWAIINSESNKLQYIASGTIKTNSKDDISQRLSEIYNAVLGIIKTHNPLEMAIEDSFVNVSFLPSTNNFIFLLNKAINGNKRDAIKTNIL